MIDLCKVFALEKDRSCSLFLSLFKVVGSKLDDLLAALDSLKSAAIAIRDWRNKLAHNLLTISAQDFEKLVVTARKLLPSIHLAMSCISEGHRPELAEAALAEVERIVSRDVQIGTLSDRECQLIAQLRQQLEEEEEERDRLKQEISSLKIKLSRKFDSLRVRLVGEIKEQLIPSNFSLFCFVFRFRICFTFAPGNKINSGSQGSVYRVKHPLYTEPFLAVKLFKSGDIESCEASRQSLVEASGGTRGDSAPSEAWRRDLNSLTILTHPNIVRMYFVVYERTEDRAQSRRPVGYGMELMASSAADRADYTLAQLLSIFEQIAGALTDCHENGVVHFDVKPENILLDGACKVAKLCDFGFAHKLKSSSNSAHSISALSNRGTVYYQAPETFYPNFESSPSAKLCDVYSFGKTMWKLLHPSQGIVPNFCSPVTAAGVPPALKKLIEQCTREMKDRPQMSDVLERLKRIRNEMQPEA
jgi:serine/threonine protein kinase